MKKYQPRNLKSYWDDYYLSKEKIFPNSSFAEFCLQFINTKSNNSLIDIGCGDGRDSLYFSKKNIKTFGIDFSEEAINKNRYYENEYLKFKYFDLREITELKSKFDFAYCRFLFHAVDSDIEDRLIVWLKNINNKVFIETRILDDKNIIQKENHYRRFFKSQDFLEKLKKNNFTIIYSEESRSFSKYKDIYKVEDIKSDPLLLRVIIQSKN